MSNNEVSLTLIVLFISGIVTCTLILLKDGKVFIEAPWMD